MLPDSDSNSIVFRILFLNIQCLRNKINILQAALEDFKIDCVCLSEHWLNKYECDNVHLVDFDTATFFARSSSKHGGVLQLITSKLQFEPLPWISALSKEIDCEVSGMIVPFYSLIVISVYRSPLGDLNTFLDVINNLLQRIKYNTCNIIIGGDFNVHFEKVNNNNVELVLDLFRSYGLLPQVNFCTRMNSIIDNVFTNVPASCIEVYTLDSALSDHIGVVSNIKINIVDKCNNISSTFRPITEAGKIMFYSLMLNIDWFFISTDIDIENKFSMLLNNIVTAFQAAFPTRQLCRKGSVKSDRKVQWFTNTLRKMRETLQFISEAYKTRQTHELKLMLCNFRKNYNAAIKKAKTAANNEYLNKNNMSPKAMWSVINQNRVKPTKYFPHATPNEVNSYFSNIADQLLDTLPICNVNPINYLQNKASKNNLIFNFREVSFNEVRLCFNDLKSSNSIDVYELSATVLKSIRNTLIIPLTKIINECIRKTIFPSCLKIALITPLYKKGDTEELSNYRPISILPIISKIFEKLIANQILEYLEDNDLLCKNQFGFRKGLSTVQAISELVSKITDAFENKEHYFTMFLDLSKAFDTVSHELLISKLKYYNFSDSSVTLLKSYLNNRYQLVNVNEKLSDKMIVKHGVPQGSILGPLLFLLYINDLPTYVPQIDTILYADDTTIGYSNSDIEYSTHFVSGAFEHVERWLTANRLHINKDKTVKIIFSLRIMLDNLEFSNATRFLGVVIDSKLTWQSHTEFLAGKLCKNIYLLRNLANNVSDQPLKVAYFAVIHSLLNYCIVLWGHCASAQRLFRLQRRAIRIIARIHYRDDCKAYFKKLNILTLPCMYIYNCLLYMFDNLENYSFAYEQHNYLVRANNIRLNNLRLNRSRNCINYYCVKFFNVLPRQVRSLPKNLFCKKMKKFLIYKAFYKVEEFLSNDFGDFYDTVNI